MKRFLICILVLCFSFNQCACNNNPPTDSSVYTEEATDIDVDYTSEYTVSDNVILESSKAEKTKFEVEMTVNISSVNKQGIATMTAKTEFSLNTENVTLEMINGNDEISIVCSGSWRLEKLVDGKYVEVINSNDKCNSSCGPNASCFVLCDLSKYSHLISEGKYRFISPTLNITKETEKGLQDYIYQNEKSFILYSEFEFVK